MVIRAAMVEVLTSKTTTWEKDRGVEFLYDNVIPLTFKNTNSKQERIRERSFFFG